jgi:hypothetical protein
VKPRMGVVRAGENTPALVMATSRGLYLGESEGAGDGPRGVISGSITYNPEPLEKPAPGNVLVCCSQPNAGVTLDL